MTIRPRLFVCLAALVAPFSSHAQQEILDSPPLFQVELLLFSHLDQSRTSAEIPRPAEPQIEDVLDQQLAQMNIEPELADETPGDLLIVPRWAPVPEDLLAMDTDASRLQRLQAYDLLAHLAWQQTANDVAIAEEIELAELGAAAGINGTVKFYRKKYLHLAIDVALDKSPGMGVGTGPVMDQASPSIIDSRRMRLGRTVYFDQPEFGVLATVYKVEPPPEELTGEE